MSTTLPSVQWSPFSANNIMDEAEKKLNNKMAHRIQSAHPGKRVSILDDKEQRFMEKVAKPYPHCVICKNKPIL